MADPDRIEIRGLRVVVHVGVPGAERASAQPLDLDLDLELPLGASGGSDDVADTADYGAVCDAVVAAVTAAPMKLLERVAAMAADAALAADHRIDAVAVTVRKVRPPVPHDVATTGVRIHRRRP